MTKTLENELNGCGDKREKHPCFCSDARKYVRLHIPIAATCNITCNYCDRRYDCQNESRPGVTSLVMDQKEAFLKFLSARAMYKNLTVVGVAGPGDALADFEKTKAVLEMIRHEDSKVEFCLSTNGLLIPRYAMQILALGIRFVTITINAVDPEIGKYIYKNIQIDGKVLNGKEGAKLLIENQLEGLRFLAKHNVSCKVNTVVIKNVNSMHIEDIVKQVRDFGASISNITSLIPVYGTLFSNIPMISSEELHKIRIKCSRYIKQMFHCKQCRSDAVGTLTDERLDESANIGCGGYMIKQNSEAKCCVI